MQCPTCKGTGLQDENTLCPVCQGFGKIEGKEVIETEVAEPVVEANGSEEIKQEAESFSPSEEVVEEVEEPTEEVVEETKE